MKLYHQLIHINENKYNNKYNSCGQAATFKEQRITYPATYLFVSQRKVLLLKVGSSTAQEKKL